MSEAKYANMPLQSFDPELIDHLHLKSVAFKEGDKSVSAHLGFLARSIEIPRNVDDRNLGVFLEIEKGLQ